MGMDTDMAPAIMEGGITDAATTAITAATTLVITDTTAGTIQVMGMDTSDITQAMGTGMGTDTGTAITTLATVTTNCAEPPGLRGISFDPCKVRYLLAIKASIASYSSKAGTCSSFHP